jgi:hypothetical protein
LETIVALRPDIVVMTDDGNTEAFRNRLNTLGIKTCIFWARRLSELSDGIKELGKTLGAEERAAEKAERIERFIPVWKEAAEFMLIAAGVTVDRSDIIPLFDEPETIQPVTEANITQTRVNSGVPLVTALREEGWSKSKLEQLNKDILEAKTQQTSMAAAILEKMRDEEAQNNPPIE